MCPTSFNHILAFEEPSENKFIKTLIKTSFFTLVIFLASAVTNEGYVAV